MKTKHIKTAAILAFLSMAALSPLTADTVGYWRFEGTSGVTIGTDPNVYNPGTVDATGQNSAYYYTEVPGELIQVPGDGIDLPNTSSMYIGGARQATVANSSVLNVSSFTMEFFILLPSNTTTTGFPAMVSRRQSSLGWALRLNESSDVLYAQLSTESNNNQLINGANILDGQWHHVALTFDGTIGKAELFIDYVSLGTRTITGAATDVSNGGGADLILGGRATDSDNNPTQAYFDEARYSDKVLTTGEMLRIQPIPEPAGVAVGLGLLVFMAAFARRCRMSRSVL